MQTERLTTLRDKLLSPWPGIWGGTWKRRNLLGGHLFRIEVLIFGLLVIAIPYFGSNIIAAANGVTFWDPEITLDRQIPVIGWMIAPYMALYLFYPATLISNPRDDRHRLELIAGVQMLSLATIFCSLFFLAFPAEIDMRRDIDWDSLSGWQASLFEMVHKMDQPWNAWPSLHIAHSYFLAHAITRWVKAGHGDSTGSRLFLLVLWVEFILLCISILTTKQHYIWDLGTGLLVGFIGWRIALPVLDSIRALPDAEIHPFPNH